MSYRLPQYAIRKTISPNGAVNLRTDGRSAVVAFRNEKPKGIKRWFYYRLEKDVNGVFQVQPAD